MRYRFAAVLLLAAAAAAGADTVRGRVIEADTGQPIAGANVAGPRTATVTGVAGGFHLAAAPGDSITVSHVGYASVTVVAADLLDIALHATMLHADAVIVRAGLTDESLQRAAASVTVLGAAQLREAGRGHFQDLAGGIANLNWSGGTSRPRYFQVRGIGERSRYAGEGPPSFSVGTVVDDVDLSGLGTGGLLFDVEQVEVYRGPQSAIFGANAMAGLISLRSTAPTGVLDHDLQAEVGGDGLAGAQGFVNLPLGRDLAVRIGYGHRRADGFRHNEALGRDDSNRRRETVARAKARYAPAGGPTVTLTAFRIDAANGYDAWAPDNNEALVTYADHPGVDHQETAAVSMRAEVPLNGDGLRLVSISAYSTTDGEYSFDSDWGSEAFWRQKPYEFDPAVEGWSYDFFDRMVRERTTWAQETRLVVDDLPGGGQAVAGVYLKRLDEETDADGFLFGLSDPTDLQSRFEIDELAFYARHRRPLSEDLHLTATLRADHNRNRYRGVSSAGAERVDFASDGWLPGGRAALSYSLSAAATAFAAVSRGYRAGGVNQHPHLADANRPYEAEYLLSYEAGYRSAGPRSSTSATAFYGRRSAQQVELSTQQDPRDPSSFVYFTNNAGGGWNAGVELEQRHRMRPALELTGSLGLLASRVDEYSFLTESGERLALGDRAAAHAPSYHLRLAAAYGAGRGPTAGLEWTAMDAFYFSDSHDQRSDAYGLLNGRLGYRGATWSVELWGRNLLDARYAVRGFYFGLEPPSYDQRLYVSYGDPRQVGVTVRARLVDLVPGAGNDG